MALGIQLVILAGLFVAASNYCLRRSAGIAGSTKVYWMLQLSVIFLVAILLNPVRLHHYAWSTPMALFGLLGGLFLAGMAISLGRAVECGPYGLTFAILNSSSVMPMLLMVLFFGAQYGFHYTPFNALGSFLVVIGIFWASSQVMKGGAHRRWAFLAFLAFATHTLFLLFMQWRALFINFPGDDGLYLSFDVNDAKSQWFMPMVFLSAAVVQAAVFFKTERRKIKPREYFWGILGGITNGTGTFFLICATEVSTPFEHAMLFPLFAVNIIIVTNLIGQILYKEKVNWLANGLCLLGIILGTIDWKMFF